MYIKDLGPWTKAVKNTALGAETTGNATSLLVDVDGFYSQVQSLNSMKVAAGAPRVVIVAGGSGMTSLMGFIQVSLGMLLGLSGGYGSVCRRVRGVVLVMDTVTKFALV